VTESDQEATDLIADDPESATIVVAAPPWMVETEASR
jgi:hypothetical protein